LKKLDLTLNFIDVDTLEQSIANLQANTDLQDLTLTGNPCDRWPDCRPFILSQLPKLTRIDGTDVTRSERLKALQRRDELISALRAQAQAKRAADAKSAADSKSAASSASAATAAAGDTKSVGREPGSGAAEQAYSPALRMEMLRESEARDAKRKAEEEETRRRNRIERDPWSAAKDKLNEKVILRDGDPIPSQRNPTQMVRTAAPLSALTRGGST
jgi:protein TilB